MRSIRGHVFLDANADGRHDANESPLAGAIVALGQRRAVSDASGSFTLKGLPAGSGSVTVVGPPEGWTLAAPLKIGLSEAPQTIEGIHLALEPE